MTKKFAGKTAIVTGGSRGIGKSIVERFAKEGANVAIVDINQQAIEQTCKELREEGYPVFAKVASVSDQEEMENAVQEIYELQFH